jgi:hypothetical protein
MDQLYRYPQVHNLDTPLQKHSTLNYLAYYSEQKVNDQYLTHYHESIINILMIPVSSADLYSMVNKDMEPFFYPHHRRNHAVGLLFLVKTLYVL